MFNVLRHDHLDFLAKRRKALPTRSRTDAAHLPRVYQRHIRLNALHPRRRIHLVIDNGLGLDRSPDVHLCPPRTRQTRLNESARTHSPRNTLRSPTHTLHRHRKPHRLLRQRDSRRNLRHLLLDLDTNSDTQTTHGSKSSSPTPKTSTSIGCV